MGKKYRLIQGTTEEDAVFEEIEEVPTPHTRQATIQGKLKLINMYQSEIGRLMNEIKQMKDALKSASS